MRDTTDPRRHATRAALYGAVAVPFLYPEQDRIDALRDPAAREGVRTAADRFGLREEVERLLTAVEETDLADLEAAYNDLFGLPDGDQYPVVPYEAHYTTGAEVSQEQRRIATVVGLMAEFGVEPGEGFDERQDHLASELELMQVVASQRAAARHENDADAAGELARAEATILAEHLADFVPSLAHDLREASENEVYLAAVDLLEVLVERDRARHPDPPSLPDDAAGAEVRNGA